MADRSPDESVPDQTGTRSATSRKTADSPSTGKAARSTQRSRTGQGARTSGTQAAQSSGGQSSGAQASGAQAVGASPATSAPRRPAQPRKSAAKPASGSTSSAASDGSGATPQAGGPTPDASPPQRAPEPAPMTERVNAAYASSGPVVADDAPSSATPRPAAATRPSGSERFAAATAGSRTDQRKPATSRPWDAPRRVRKARLRVTHVDPWSVMKTAFLLAVALGIVTVVAVAVVWSVLDAAGVWGSIDKAVGDVVGATSNNFRIEDYLGLSRVLGFTLIVAVVDVVLVTVIATLGAFLYNLAAALLGGIEVVLAEEDH